MTAARKEMQLVVRPAAQVMRRSAEPSAQHDVLVDIAECSVAVLIGVFEERQAVCVDAMEAGPASSAAVALSHPSAW